jgi:hypothetical protein
MMAWDQLVSFEHTEELIGVTPADRHLQEFKILQMFSFGRSTARATLVGLSGRQDEAAVMLVAAACESSMRPGSSAHELESALATYEESPNPDPLWPALARHLARRREEGDWELLEDLARHPEKREPPLSWGLRFIVRGDLVMDDGSVVELDTLSRQHGLQPLPYIEELPDEIDLG